MHLRKIPGLLSFFCMIGWGAMAQVTENQRKYTAFDMRSNGKIYVVVAVMLIIMLGLLLYMARIDAKITRMENKAAKDNPDA